MKSIILAGGKGTRTGVKDVPKPLIKFLGNNILEYNLKSLPIYSDYFFVLGYKSDQILKYLQKKNFEFEYYVESKALGTGGWIFKLDNSTYSPNFVVCNGDDIIDVNWLEVIIDHLRNDAYITTIIVKDTDAFDKGRIVFDDKNRITEFNEKTGEHSEAWINSGFHIFNKNVISYIKRTETFKKFLNGETKVMLETDIFPELIKTKRLFVYKCFGKWADTGTKTRIKNAESLFSEPIIK